MNVREKRAIKSYIVTDGVKKKNSIMQKGNKSWLHHKRANKPIRQKLSNGKGRKISLEKGMEREDTRSHPEKLFLAHAPQLL